MNKTVILNKLYPNIEGLPVRISKDHAECYSESGRKFCCMHAHHEIELLYIYEGSTTVELYDGTKYYATKNDVVCINSDISHITYASEKCYTQHGLIQFDATAFGNNKNYITKYNETLSIIAKEPDIPVYISKDEELHNICNTTFDWFNNKKSAKNLYVASGIYAILAFLCEKNFISDYTKGIDLTKLERLNPALVYISQKYHDDISLEDVSSAVNMSSFYFCRFFKDTLGIGFTDYLKLYRIKKAEAQLIETEKSVLEIAFENGFSSASYFNRVFKEYRFCSPSEYRRISKESVKFIKP